MNESERIESDLIEKAVTKGIKRALSEIGVETSNPQEMQKDLAHLRAMRKGSEETAKHVKRAAIGVFVFSMLYGLWVGVQQLVHVPVK